MRKRISIFDIQPFSWHDGPGIRTVVFLKGCNLDCFWCHNPESHSFESELLFHKDRCIFCGKCIELCPNGCHYQTSDGKHGVDRLRCTKCGKCAENCFSEALKLSGREMSAEEILENVLKDKEFYDASGGGVTLSGGEPLLQVDGCLEVLKLCRQNGIGTAVDTAGHLDWSRLELVLPFTDYVLYDIKVVDEQLHKNVCGVSNKRILSNLRKLQQHGVRTIIRVPIVPGVNDNRREMNSIASLIADMDNIVKIDLLPFHGWGESKYAALGKQTRTSAMTAPEPSLIEGLNRVLEKRLQNIEIEHHCQEGGRNYVVGKN